MKEYEVNNLVFSSSATVYGEAKSPIKEDVQLSATNPYGRTKLFLEEIIKDTSNSSNLKPGILRYFNPIGAHKSGYLGDNPNGGPNNLMPFISNVYLQKSPHLKVFGDNYNTIDGTGIRDYIHVTDLALGHIKALNYLLDNEKGFEVNLGSGRGYSVLEVIKTFEEVSGTKIPYKIENRRPGDLDICYADTTKAKDLLGFETKKDLKDMCFSTFNYLKRK